MVNPDSKSKGTEAKAREGIKCQKARAGLLTISKWKGGDVYSQLTAGTSLGEACVLSSTCRQVMQQNPDPNGVHPHTRLGGSH